MCQRNYLSYYFIAIFLGFSLLGCARQKLIKENTAIAIELDGAIGVYESMQYKGGLPKTLYDLVSVGLLKKIPQCKCADGKLRDFVYISGYDQTISPYVILASPPEMDPKVMIVVYMGLTAKVMPREAAVKEIEKSRAFAAKIQEQLKNVMPAQGMTTNNVKGQ